MNKRQARFLLLSHRAGRDAGSDPQMDEALREAGHDPALAAWLEGEQATDGTLRARLREVSPPPGLQARLLEAPPLVETASTGPRWKFLAWAAALALLAAITATWLWPREAQSNFAVFQDEMLRAAAGPIRFDFASGDARELERWLNERAAPGPIGLPAAARSLPGLGCREWKWRGRPVALLCLRAGDGRALHIFAIARADLRDAPDEGPARFAASGGMQTAAWRQGGVVYVTALRGGETELRQHLGMSSL